MQAFYGDANLKKTYISRVRAHRLAGEIVKNVHWANGRGGAIGCTIHGADPQAFEKELGIPAILAAVLEAIFDGMPLQQGGALPEKFLRAIRPGVDLTNVLGNYFLWLLDDPREGAFRFYNAYPQQEATRLVAQLYRNGCKRLGKWQQAAAAALDAEAFVAYHTACVKTEKTERAWQAAAHAVSDAAYLALLAARANAAKAPHASTLVDPETASAAAHARQFKKLLILMRAA